MEEDSKTVTIMTPASFIAEIMLILMGLCGIAVVGVTVGFFYSLSLFLIGLGFVVGIGTVLLSIVGVYVLLYHDYRRLKLFISFLAFFICLQIALIIHSYFFTNTLETTDEQQGSIIVLDVCFGLSASALLALALHLKQKGSTIEMVKL